MKQVAYHYDPPELRANLPMCELRAEHLLTSILQAVQNPRDRWISVLDRLPDDKAEVFFVRRKEVFRGHWFLEPAPHFAPHRGCRYWYPSENVTHWMPSPTPLPPQ